MDDELPYEERGDEITTNECYVTSQIARHVGVARVDLVEEELKNVRLERVE